MICQRNVFRYFVEFLDLQIDIVCFRAIDHLLLESVVNFSEGHWRHFCAEYLEGIDHHLAVDHSQLEVTQIIRNLDRVLAVPDAARSGEAPTKEHHVQLVFGLLGKLGTDITIKNLVIVVHALENERVV